MSDIAFQKSKKTLTENLEVLKILLQSLKHPFTKGDTIGIKTHWGEQGNTSFLPPDYVHEIAKWLKKIGAKPFVFDTTVLYSGKRRTAEDSLKTAAKHGYKEKFLGCPVIVADGLDGRDVVEIPADYKHFKTVQVASLVNNTDGFIIFSHFKGHLLSCFGGAIKNISMGFASRAQKQRMHANARPVLKKDKCTTCGICVDFCPTGAAQIGEDEYPTYDMKKCIGCAQCIALCPHIALKILWDGDDTEFQEKLIETAAAAWKIIGEKTICINALIDISKECDCMPGENPIIAEDFGFIAGHHPVTVDKESIEHIGEELIDKAHPNLPWRRQFDYAREIGFDE